MTNDSNNNTVGSIEERRIANATAELGSVYSPEHDLWPTIKDRITDADSDVKPMPKWMPYALAASILMTLVSLGVSTNLYIQQTNSLTTASNDYIDVIEQPYILARVSFLEEMVMQLSLIHI